MAGPATPTSATVPVTRSADHTRPDKAKAARRTARSVEYATMPPAAALDRSRLARSSGGSCSGPGPSRTTGSATRRSVPLSTSSTSNRFTGSVPDSDRRNATRRPSGDTANSPGSPSRNRPLRAKRRGKAPALITAPCHEGTAATGRWRCGECMSASAKGYLSLGKGHAASGDAGTGERPGVFGVNQNDAGSARSGRRLGIAAAAAALVLSAAGCAGLAAAKPPPAAQVTITPASGTQSVSPTAGVTVSVAHGKLRDVVVRAAGDPLSGQLSMRGTVWHSQGLLNPSHVYTVTAIAVGSGGKKVTATSSFRTLKPRKT